MPNKGKIQSKKRKEQVIALSCVGMKYRMSRKDIAQLAEVAKEEFGLSCKLVPEPNNEVDPDAVMVVALDLEKDRFTGMHIGYVGRPVNVPLLKLFERGWEVKSCYLISADIESGVGELEATLTYRVKDRPATYIDQQGVRER